jgi:formate hydrogenlyase subunit 4
LFLALAVVARQTGCLCLSDMQLALSTTAWGHSALLLNLVAVVLLVLFLAENSRIPVDDPSTHLELTMIHEVMVLDHGGPDLAFILYAAALKLWLFGVLIIDLVIPTRAGWAPANLALAVAGMLVLAVLLGVIESAMARLRMMRVPELLVGAATLAGLALVLVYGGVLS